VDCWLVNTGWTGGKYGTGRRMPIKATRALLTAALNGSLRSADFRTDKYFGFAVPTSLPGVEPHILESDQDLGRQGRVRQDRPRAGRHVPEEFCQVRKGRRRRRPCRGAGFENWRQSNSAPSFRGARALARANPESATLSRLLGSGFARRRAPE